VNRLTVPTYRLGWPILAAALIAILVATLLPIDPQPVYAPATCLICGDRATADATANVILFTPLGIAFALLGLGLSRSLILGAVLSLGIELLQFSAIPGRDASAGDVVFDTLGTAVGLFVVLTASHWLRPSDRRASRLALGTGILSTLVFAMTGVLLAPSLPRSSYFGRWTPDLGGLEWYRGRVLEVNLATSLLPSQPLADSDSVRSFLLKGATLDVRAVAGPRIPALGSLFSIYDDAQKEIILLGPDRDDLVFRYRTRAKMLRLDQPSLRLRDQMAGVSPGDTIRIRVWRDGHYCVALDDRPVCGLGFTVGTGWAMLFYSEILPYWLLRLLNFGWIGGLLIPFGFWARANRLSLIGGAAILIGMVALPSVLKLLPTPGFEWLGAIAGISVGRGIRWAILYQPRFLRQVGGSIRRPSS